MNFLQDAFREPEDDIVDDTGPDSATYTITLDITYDDPELHALFPVASSKWANENLTDSLKQGRVTNDLWALGLPIPDAVTSVCITEDHYLCVRAVVTCDELVDLTSLSDPANKNRQQLKIKNISIIERKSAPNVQGHQSPRDEVCKISTASSDDTVGISPFTTLTDYYRRRHLGALTLMPSTVPHPFTPANTREPFQSHSEPITVPTGGGTSVQDNLTELEKKLFSTELELGLQSRRLKEARNDIQKRQAEVDRFTSRLRDKEVELASAKAQLGNQLGNTGDSLARDVDEVPEEADSDKSHDHTTVIEAPDTALIVDIPEPLSCVRCELRSQSAKLSELQLSAMELRVTMSERRQTETESHAVRLLNALQSERQMRERLEAELLVERQKRRGAEAMGEAIANEAKWPFVMPDMLDVFLKLEGIVEEVSREGKEVE